MDSRRDEARAAIQAVVEQHRDIIGPQCWCGPVGAEGDDHAGLPDDPCPSIPATVGLSGWALVLEYSDLNPDTRIVGTTYVANATQSPNLSKGLHLRAAEHY